jgi:hypothetical protein
MLSSIIPLFALVLFLQNVGLASAFHRTVGPTYDGLFQNLSAMCNGSDPAMYTFGNCTRLIDCVYQNVSPSFSQTLSIGASISGLLPTILVLIGMSFLIRHIGRVLTSLAP